MKEKNNSKVIFITAIVSILLCIPLGIYIGATFINSKETQNVDEKANQNKENIAVSIEIGNLFVSKDAINEKIFIDGTIELAYDEDKYIGVSLGGYCLGNDNEKYLIHGPGSGATLFTNGKTELYLTENIPQSVKYSDGTTISWDEIDWEWVSIKYCEINEMHAVDKTGVEFSRPIKFSKTFESYKYSEKEVFESIKIKSIVLENPRVSSYGGVTNNTIALDANVDIESINPDIIGIKISGYCIDSADNKYLASGPLGVMAFYSKDNDSYAEVGSITLRVEEENSEEVNWQSVKIKYCKIDSALYLGKNGEYIGPSDSQYYKKVLNYEFNF